MSILAIGVTGTAMTAALVGSVLLQLLQGRSASKARKRDEKSLKIQEFLETLAPEMAKVGTQRTARVKRDAIRDNLTEIRKNNLMNEERQLDQTARQMQLAMGQSRIQNLQQMAGQMNATQGQVGAASGGEMAPIIELLRR